VLNAQLPAATTPTSPELRLVETYVPYDEFLKLTAGNVDATMMSLDEYRALATLAAVGRASLPAGGHGGPPYLPPVSCVLSEAVYTGTARETAVRFDATFKLTVAEDGWARCDLGPVQGAGKITLDDKPAWVVFDQKHMYLLVKGPGLHTGSLSFSLPLQREEDIQRMNGALLSSASARMNLTVSGRATLASDAIPADTDYDEKQNVTRFSLALGTQKGAPLSLNWKRKYDAQKNPPLLLSEQRISYLIEPAAGAQFRWAAKVSIARRKGDELVLVEPPGGRLVRLSGPAVHSWHRDGESIRVLLQTPILGDVDLQGDGLLPAQKADVELGCMQVKGAARDTRYLGLFQPGAERLAIGAVNGFREVAFSEAAVPVFQEGRLAHVYLLETSGAKLTVRVKPQPPVFDTQVVSNLLLGERFAILRSAITVRPEQGRVYAVRLLVPAQWQLLRLAERGTGRGLSAEKESSGTDEAWTIALEQAADPGHAFELDAQFRLRELAPAETDWQTLAIDTPLPAVTGARRSVSRLGLGAHPSIDITFGAMPEWRTERPGTLESLGVHEATARAALISEAAAPALHLQLTHKKPRGEYELVTHTLTLEREVLVRSDIRLAVVDRALDELVISLPPEAKDPLFIQSVEIKEIVPVTPALQPGANQRRVRFNSPWQGVRVLRVEYRAPIAADGTMAIPDLRVEGGFDSRRRIVFQSAGVVELSVQPGPGLAAASLEDTPEFSRSFQTGRALQAFTFLAAGAPGTYRSRLLERYPAQGNLTKELNLTTVLDASGVSRTHVDFQLAYSGLQYAPVKLPRDARLLALCVDGQSVKPVAGSKTTDANAIDIPLPPRSFARVEFAYQITGTPLGNFGSYQQQAPELEGISVGVTNWKFHYPAAYSVAVTDGNVEPDPSVPPAFFASNVVRMLRGDGPWWTSWAEQLPQRTVELTSAPTGGDAAKSVPQQETKQLTAIENATTEAPERSVAGLAIPEGVLLKLSKLGGSAKVTLGYRELSWSFFAARSVFLATVLFGLWLALRVSRRAALRLVAYGLVFGTLVPLALKWQSPLLLIPFCEGLSLLAVAGLFWYGGGWLWRRIAERRGNTSAKAVTAIVIVMLVVAAIWHSSASAGEAEVLIPYAKEKLPVVGGPDQKVFVPKSVFLELMARAHPEQATGRDARATIPDMNDRRNLALASAGAKASGGNSPQSLIDGNPAPTALEAFAWGLVAARDKSVAATAVFTIELPKAASIDRVRIMLPDHAQRFWRYKVELSEDGKTFLLLTDKTQGQYRGWQTENFSKRDVKALRLTGTYDSDPAGRFYAGKIEMLTPPTPVPLALGNAQYELTAGEKTYEGKGTLEVATFNPKGWVKLPLDFGPTQLVALKIDGQPASVGHERGVPFVELKGGGVHKLEMDVQGMLELGHGSARLLGRFVCGAATRVVLSLPAAMELETKALPPGAWVEVDAQTKTQRCEVDLGSGSASADVALLWRSPDIRGKGTSQIASRSYSQLQASADGYAVVRVDRVTVDGPGVDQLTYKLLGNWDIATVTAQGLAEWTISGEGDARQLRLWFQKPVNEVIVQLAGWAPLPTDAAGTEARPAATQVAALSLEGALRQEGFIGLQYGSGRRFTARSLEGLKRASSQELAVMFTLPAESLPDRIYRCPQTPEKTLVSAELEAGQTTVETQVVGVVLPDRMTACVRSRYMVTGVGPLRHEIDLPPQWQVRTVRSNAMRDWDVVGDPGKQRLVIYFAARAATGTEIVWSAETPLTLPAGGPLSLDLPQPRCATEGKLTETVDWVLASDQSLVLSQGAGTQTHALPIERAPTWVRLETGQDYRFAYRVSKPEYKLAVSVSKQASIGSATLVSFIRPAEDYVQINARCRLRIEQAGRDRFVFKLPAKATLVSLDARNLRSRELSEKPDGTLLTVVLQSPVSGEQVIDLAYRLPRAAGQELTLSAMEITDAEITQTEQFVGLLQIEQGLVTALPKHGLTQLRESEELPFLPQGVSKSALAQVFAAQPDWSLALRQPGVRIETGPPAEVLLAVLKTVVAADGGVRSMATYSLHNRALQFLSLVMPADTKLWGVLVDGRPVTVSHSTQGQDKVLLVPIQRMAASDRPLKVSLFYESPAVKLPAALRTITPSAPKVIDKDVPVVQTFWELCVPDDYDVSRSSSSNVREVPASALIGGQLSSIIQENERLKKIADAAESPTQRRKALQRLLLNRKDLEDNVTELQKTEQNSNVEEQRRVGREEFAQNSQANIRLQQEGETWRQNLTTGELSKKIEQAVAEAAVDPQQQAFLDGYNFLGNNWRGGAQYKAGRDASSAQGRPPYASGEMALAELQESRPAKGFQKNELPPAPAARARQDTEPLKTDAGLREGSEQQLNLEKGAMDLHIPQRGTCLTFRRIEGHPELTVTLRSRSETWRYSALLALLAIAGVVAYARRSSSRQGRS
jgi:hypothetical protein